VIFAPSLSLLPNPGLAWALAQNYVKGVCGVSGLFSALYWYYRKWVGE
jgi:hypothetical protein